MFTKIQSWFKSCSFVRMIDLFLKYLTKQIFYKSLGIHTCLEIMIAGLVQGIMCLTDQGWIGVTFVAMNAQPRELEQMLTMKENVETFQGNTAEMLCLGSSIKYLGISR